MPQPEQPAAPPVEWKLTDYHVPEQEGKTRFHDLNADPAILHAVHDLKFTYCTPIQAQILPITLDGKDAAGRAQTGTGKTAAFLITIFQHLIRAGIANKQPPGTPRALILAPTRELVVQIERDAQSLGKYLPFSCLAVYGGTQFDRQRRALEQESTDIVAATPGRLIDFLQRGTLQLGKIEILVIDEADRMLDMGFIPDVRRIVRRTPPREQRQTLLFSATLDDEVMRLASQWMRDPVKIEIAPEHVAAQTVHQRVYIVTAAQKFDLLYNLVQAEKPERILIFVNRKDTAMDLVTRLRACGMDTMIMSGDVSQNERERTLEQFREGQKRVLVATDVASRGLHVDGISHIVNYNVPHNPEDYVHRIGRTGRAGASGVSITFACEDESHTLPDIEEFMGQNLDFIHPDEALLAPIKDKPPRTGRRRRRSRGGRGRGGRDRQAPQGEANGSGSDSRPGEAAAAAPESAPAP